MNSQLSTLTLKKVSVEANDSVSIGSPRTDNEDVTTQMQSNALNVDFKKGKEKKSRFIVKPIPVEVHKIAHNTSNLT